MRCSTMVLMLACLAGAAPNGGCTRGAASADPEPAVTPPPLPADYMAPLDAVGWADRVDRAARTTASPVDQQISSDRSRTGIWVSVQRQRLYVICERRIAREFPCSTAARGVGNQDGSYRTPLGWHVVDERYGDGLPEGAVFRERIFTGRVWRPGAPVEGDMILTRILWLRGVEPGINSGPGIDSHDRYIYIHGTPEEDRIGRAASLGCVRMMNADMIALYDLAESGTPVLITEW